MHSAHRLSQAVRPLALGLAVGTAILGAPAQAAGLYELGGNHWFGGLGFERRTVIGTPMLALQVRELPALAGGYRWDERNSLSLQFLPASRRDGVPREVDLTYRTSLGIDQFTVDLRSSLTLAPAGQQQRLGLKVSAGVRF